MVCPKSFDTPCSSCQNPRRYSTYKDLCANCGRKNKQDRMSKIYCKCGCGELIESKSISGKIKLYKQGHNIGRGVNNMFFKTGVVDRGGNKKYTKTLVSTHPFKNKDGYIATHRLILEKYLSEKYGRETFILPYFDVHHIDGNTRNNDPSNLMYLHRRQHSMIHHPIIKRDKNKCIFCDCDNNDKTIWYKDLEYGYYCGKCYKKLKRFNIKNVIYSF